MTVIELIGKLRSATHAEDFDVMLEDECTDDLQSVRVDRECKQIVLSTQEVSDG